MYVKLDNEKVTDKLPVNTRIAEHQPQYETFPCHRTSTGLVVAAVDLTDEDIEKIKKHRKIFYLQVVGTVNQYNVKLSKEQMQEIIKDSNKETKVLSILAESNMQPIDIALTPEDIEEAVNYTHEELLPTSGDQNA